MLLFLEYKICPIDAMLSYILIAFILNLYPFFPQEWPPMTFPLFSSLLSGIIHSIWRAVCIIETHPNS